MAIHVPEKPNGFVANLLLTSRHPFAYKNDKPPDEKTLGNYFTGGSNSFYKYNLAGSAVWGLNLSSVKADATIFCAPGVYLSSTERLYILVWKSGYVALGVINTNTGAVVSASSWHAVSAMTFTPNYNIFCESRY